MNRLSKILQEIAFKCLPYASPLWGRVLLSRRKSLKKLSSFTVYSSLSKPVCLPALRSLNGLWLLEKGYAVDHPITFDPDYVWRIESKSAVSSLRLVPSGNIVINNHTHLNLDFRPLRGLLQTHAASLHEDTVISCWAHGWRSYFDYVLFVLTKLVRIEKALGPEVFRNARLAYSKFNLPFERDFLALLGVDAESVIDTQQLQGALVARTVITANNHTVYYPSPNDLKLIRGRFAQSNQSQGGRRLYLARSKPRLVVNEAELRPILDRHGIEYIADEPRSVQEQINLFSRASLVVGPHGAGFTNILWCPPQTRIIELFHGSYHPPYYYYLSAVLGHLYSCWISSQHYGSRTQIASQYSNIYVPSEELARCLAEQDSN